MDKRHKCFSYPSAVLCRFPFPVAGWVRVWYIIKIEITASGPRSERRDMMNDLTYAQFILEKITAAEREAAALMLEAHGVMAETKTSRRDVVTEYDRRVQDLLTLRLRGAVPDARFFCEEQEEKDDINADHLFVIDPIDGTMNFVRGFHHSCISVGYAEQGELKAAAIYNPYVDEMFTATSGGGAFLNGKPIHADDAPLKETVVCFGTAPYDLALAPRCFALAQKTFAASLDVRREGSAALDLCSVAAGRAGLYFELALSPWDYAAGMLIAREAGCVCRTLEGEELRLVAQRPSVIAGGRAAVEEFLHIAEEETE